MSGRPFAWEKSYPPDAVWDIAVKPSNLSDLFDKAAADFQGRAAIEFRGVDLSFKKLHSLAENAASVFSWLGLGRGSPLALYLPNVPYHPISFFGAMKMGTPVVHLSPLDAERELAHKLNDSGARTIVTTNFAGLLPNALKMLDKGFADRILIGEDEAWGPSPFPLAAIPERDGVFSLNRLMESAVRPVSWPDVSTDDIALLQYTGGTTGMPKGAMLTHANLNASMAIYQAWDRAANAVEPGNEIVICVLPLFHIYALCPVMLRNLLSGNKLLLRVKFDAHEILRDIEVNRATAFPGVPTMWIALANRPDIDQRDLSSLRFSRRDAGALSRHDRTSA